MQSSSPPFVLSRPQGEPRDAAPRHAQGDAPSRAPLAGRIALGVVLALGAVAVLAILAWQALAAGGVPDPTTLGTGATARVVDIAVLVFREGLESILVLAAVTASFVGASRRFHRPIAAGVAAGMIATLGTWVVAARIMNSLTGSISALHLQAATGLLAIIVLLVVMNWFFHKVYWSGWISLHTRRKKALVAEAATPAASRGRVLWGFALLGFTSFYREGFEVVLFLQSYRLRLGGGPVLSGVLVGALLTAIVAILTFIAHRRLPYKKMLVATGVMLGVVLLVMVGEQAQEMQLAHWLPTTPIPALVHVLPAWVNLWLGVSPTVETLAAQLIAALLVVGSYTMVEQQLARARRPRPRSAPPVG